MKLYIVGADNEVFAREIPRPSDLERQRLVIHGYHITARSAIDERRGQLQRLATIAAEKLAKFNRKYPEEGASNGPE